MQSEEIEGRKTRRINATYSLPTNDSDSIVVLNENALNRILAAPFEIEKNNRNRPTISHESLYRVRLVLDEIVRTAIATSLTGFLPKKKLVNLCKKALKAQRIEEWIEWYRIEIEFQILWQHDSRYEDRCQLEAFSTIEKAIQNHTSLTIKQRNSLKVGLQAFKFIHAASAEFSSLVFPPTPEKITRNTFGTVLEDFRCWTDGELDEYAKVPSQLRGPKQNNHLRQMYRDLSGLLAVVEKLPRDSKQGLCGGKSNWPCFPRNHNMLLLRDFGSPLKRMIYQAHCEIYAKIPNLKLFPSPNLVKLKSLWVEPTDSDLDKNIPDWINEVYRDDELLPMREGHAEVMALRLGPLH